MRTRFKVPTSIAFLLGMTLVLGVAYPAAVTAIAQALFPAKANGSLIVVDGKVRGSSLLAQGFESPRFFRARPSATGYAYLGSGASNLGPTSAPLAASVAERRQAWDARFGSSAPDEMLYASGSGLDPELGLEAALSQLASVAEARGLEAAARGRLEAAIRAAASSRATIIGSPRVNVVALNTLLETDPAFAGRGR